MIIRGVTTNGVVANKGAGGVDGMKVEELGAYIKENKDEIVQSIRN